VVVLQTRSRSPSASVRAAERGHRIAFAIGDEALLQALRVELAAHADLAESDEDAASVVIVDAPLPGGDFETRQRVLLVGASRKAQPNETAIASLDPSLILAAATVLVFGYRIVPDHAPPEPVHLSAREKQVVGLLVEGASNKLIARKLDISVHTAKFHVTAVLEKLSARNRSDAVAIALREGLVML
jgi:DNA-binding CsgD family transcriptional regulator